MPTDHAEVALDGVRVGDDAILGELDRGLALAQRFVHENRIRQAASSLGAAALLHRRGGRVGARAHRLGQAAVAQPGDPVPARRAVDRLRAGARPRAPAPPPSSTATTTWRSPTSSRWPTTAPTASPARPPTARCRPAAAWATRATCPSSTSTATTAATGSPRAPRRSSSARSATSCSRRPPAPVA